VTARYVLVEIVDTLEGASDSDPWASLVRTDLYRQWSTVREVSFRTADVTDVVTYNRSTPGDPWDKPYPAALADIMERLS
jgi:hypothetical protein